MILSIEKIKKLQKNFARDFKESSLYIFHMNLVKEIAKDMQIKNDTNTLIIKLKDYLQDDVNSTV